MPRTESRQARISPTAAAAAQLSATVGGAVPGDLRRVDVDADDGIRPAACPSAGTAAPCGCRCRWPDQRCARAHTRRKTLRQVAAVRHQAPAVAEGHHGRLQAFGQFVDFGVGVNCTAPGDDDGRPGLGHQLGGGHRRVTVHIYRLGGCRRQKRHRAAPAHDVLRHLQRHRPLPAAEHVPKGLVYPPPARPPATWSGPTSGSGCAGSPIGRAVHAGGRCRCPALRWESGRSGRTAARWWRRRSTGRRWRSEHPAPAPRSRPPAARWSGRNRTPCTRRPARGGCR